MTLKIFVRKNFAAVLVYALMDAYDWISSPIQRFKKRTQHVKSHIFQKRNHQPGGIRSK